MYGKVYRLKNDAIGPKGITLKKFDDIHVMNNVVYMHGHPLRNDFQEPMLKWLKENKSLIIDVTNDF